MSVPPSNVTRRRIIDQALKVAGNTKILVEARVELARILADLYREHEWPFLYEEQSLTLTASTTLPSNFLKAESSDTGLRVTSIDGETTDWPVLIVTPQEWRRTAIPRAETADRPTIAMIDYTQSVLKPWPVPDTSCVALMVFKGFPALDDIDPISDPTTFDANFPVFPYARYLESALQAWALGYEKDYRAKALKDAENARMLSSILGTAIPRDANAAASLELDPATYGTPPRWNEQ